VKISVITPSFNQGQFIERTLESVAAQGGVDIEHIVCDGGSTDNTLDILKTFKPAVKWVSEPDGGQAAAVNKGIRLTSGDIIGWLNSDDIYYQGALERIAAFFSAHPGTDVVYGMADHIAADDRIIEPYPTEPWNFERLIETCFICQPALFFRRGIVEKYGLLDESLSYCMDYDYWLRLGKAGCRFDYLEQRLAGSRLHDETKTLSARVNVHREINDMFKQKFGRVPDKWLFSYAHWSVAAKPSENEKIQFVRLISASVLAALRWNRSVSEKMRKTILQWVFA
jgi:glycosyltransferase involved in cell wall biosynthesis